MRTSVSIGCVALVFFLSCTQNPPPAQERSGKQQTRDSLRITVHLKDGSNIIGIPASRGFSIRTPYGTMDVPFADISSISFLRNSDSVTVLFRNNDRLQGVLNGQICAMQTILGSISPPAKDIASLTIVRYHAVEDEGLLAYYPFEGNADDESGHNNNGVLNGAEPVPDRFGYPNGALRFNGVDAYVSIPSSPTLHPADQLSISMWLRIDAEPVLWSSVLHKGGVQSADFLNREYSFWVRANGGAPTVFFYSAGDGQGPHRINSNPLTLGAWYFVVVVADRRKHVMQLYVDGAMVSQEGDSYSTFNKNDSALRIGSSEERWEGCSPFTGAVDDVRLFGRALTPKEISEMFTRR